MYNQQKHDFWIRLIIALCCCYALLISFQQVDWDSKLITARVVSLQHDIQNAFHDQKYLSDSSSGDDIGLSLYVAHQALFTNIISSFSGKSLVDLPFKLKSIGLIQFYVTIATILLILFFQTPLLIAITAVFSILFLNYLQIMPWDFSNQWPIALAVVIMMTLIVSYSFQASLQQNKKLSLQQILSFIVIGIFLGFLGLLRRDAFFITTLPWWGIIFFHSVMFLVKKIRYRTSSFKVKYFRAAYFKMPVILLFTIIILFQSLLWIDLKLFEKVTHQTFQPALNHHVIWHPLYLGLGYQANYENIQWQDQVSYTHALQTAPEKFTKVDYNFESIMRDLYWRVVKNNPRLVLKSLLYKFLYLHAGLHWFLLFSVLFFLVCFFRILFGNIGVESLCYFCISSLILMVSCSLPGILGHPFQGKTAYACLLAILPIIGSAYLLLLKIKDPQKFRPIIVVQNIMITLGVIAGLIILIFISYYFYKIKQDQFYHQRVQKLVNHQLTWKNFMDDGYPANLVNAFNSLTFKQRTAIVSELTQSGIIKIPILKELHPNQYQWLGTWQHQQHLFFLLNCHRKNLSPPSSFFSLINQRLIPSKENIFIKIQPQKQFQKHVYADFLYKVHLPFQVQKGPYLFVIKYNPVYANGADLIIPNNPKIHLLN